MPQDFSYVFFGTPEFSARVLRQLIENDLVPRAIVANPDRPAGRRQLLAAPATKRTVLQSEAHDRIAILQPEEPMEIVSALTSLDADVYVLASYGKILPKKILSLPHHGIVGVHPSLLPRYRGTTPLQTALLNGDSETGVTLFVTDEKMDHGPIMAEARVPIENDETYTTLSGKLADLSVRLLLDKLPAYVRGEITLRPQDEARATYTKKFTAGDAFISPELFAMAKSEDMTAARNIARMIRALNPEPGVWTLDNGKRLKLLEATLDAQGLLKPTLVQPEGKRPMKPAG